MWKKGIQITWVKHQPRILDLLLDKFNMLSDSTVTGKSNIKYNVFSLPRTSQNNAGGMKKKECWGDEYYEILTIIRLR